MLAFFVTDLVRRPGKLVVPFRRIVSTGRLGLAAIALLGAATNVHVPYSTAVIVHVKSEVSSAHAQIGDSVPIEVLRDVVVDGYVVIARGADGLAQVASVTPATATAGQVQLAFKWVHAVDGSKIGVVGQQVASGGPNTSSTDPTASLDRVQKAATDSGANSNGVNQASSFLGRFKKVASDLGVSGSSKGSEGALEPDKPIALAVRNPNGVSIASSTRAVTANDDSDVK